MLRLKEGSIAALIAAHQEHPFYGVRRLALHLHWNQKKVRRIRNAAGIVIPVATKKRRTGKRGVAEISAPPNILQRYATFRNIARPQDGMDYSGMVDSGGWVQDFTYLWFQGRWHYLAVVLDLKTRRVMGWSLGLSHTSELTLAAVQDALRKYPPPTILHSDQGTEYLSYKHQLLCDRFGIQLSASAKSSPWQNGYMERWFGNFKLELGSLKQFTDLAQLHEAIALQLHYYNTERIHLALGMSPAAYAASLIPLKSSDRVLQKRGA
jgi:transposase InsO family protein